jgi:IclR family transcriptional regulator, KDG regulon repressor
MKLSSLDKSLQVLEQLNRNPQGLSLAELTQILGYPKSTIHHMLSTFAPYDYVNQDPETRKYRLGFKFLTISKSILDHIDIRRIAHKHLRDLQRKCNEAVHLYILRNGYLVCLDKIQDPGGGLSLATYIGFRTDPHAAASGKVLLSELSREAIQDMYEERPLRVYGKNTITSFSQLFGELENIQKQGYAIDNEEYYEGARCIAAPVRAGGRIAAAISVTGSIFTMTMDRINRELMPFVIDTAKAISEEMVW